MSAINKYLVAVAAVIIPFSGWIVGFIVSPGSPANDPWFNSLIKPSFNPPAWIFAPVWTFIYCSIGIASYLVYAKLVASGRGFDRTAQVALASYVIQLALNWAWPPIFFKYHLLKWVCNLIFKINKFLIKIYSLFKFSCCYNRPDGFKCDI